jgi:hypothetical protein
MNHIKYLPLGLVCLFILKVLFRGTELPDALVISALSGLSAYSLYKEKDKQYHELKEEISKLSAEVSARNQALDEMRTKIAAMVVSSGMKQIRNG